MSIDSSGNTEIKTDGINFPPKSAYRTVYTSTPEKRMKEELIRLRLLVKRLTNKE